MTEILRGRKQRLNVILPRRIKEHSDNELRLMLVTLKNAIVATSVQVMRIENELKGRGADFGILTSTKARSVSEFDLLEGHGELQWKANLKEGNALSA